MKRRLPVRVERHRRGPRLYLLGQRVHEWQVGALVVVVAAGALVGGWASELWGGVAVAAGAWLVIKDWRDLFARTRDTGAWTTGIHRRALALRDAPRADWLPAVTGFLTALVGAVNVASAVTPNVRWREALIGRIEPVESVPVFHAVALPAGAALIVVGVHLVKRRRRAWEAALVLLGALGVVNVLKGLDVEEALLCWAVAASLWWGRDAFHVRHDPISPRSAAVWIPVMGAGAVALSAAAVWAASPPRSGLGDVLRETRDLLLWRQGDMRFTDEFARLPLAVAVVGVATVVSCAWALFRPLASPRAWPDRELRRSAARIVRTHGTDTLAFFKLREDVHYVFAPDRPAFAAFRVRGGVLLLSGDPVGDREALPAVLTEVIAFAEDRGLRIGAIGAGEPLLPLYAEAGLSALYIGDEAIVDVAAFSLEGHRVKKVRQAVGRVERAGYRAEIVSLTDIDEPLLARLEEVSVAWRSGEPERGFSMALDRLGGEHQRDSLVVLARDRDGIVRGFLHFVPSYGHPAMSLSFMRRERDTPNGLTEFLVVRAIEGLRERGVRELSLNFAAFARTMHRPTSRRERAFGRLLALGNPFFQLESLYRFNAKFGPRWEPRYLLYEGRRSLARTMVAAMWAEGQLHGPESWRRSRTGSASAP